MGAASSAGRRARSFAASSGSRSPDDVGEVLGVDLVEQVPELIGVLLEDLLDVRSEQAREAHRRRAQTNLVTAVRVTPLLQHALHFARGLFRRRDPRGRRFTGAIARDEEAEVA
jgi:hypothetical protein